MNVQIIQIPYDSGNRNVRMGRGPQYILSGGLIDVLQNAGHQTWVETIEAGSEFRAEIKTQFELYKQLAYCVAKARNDEKFPLVLSGNCGASLGLVAGAEAHSLGVIWFDAHGDFNTPETTEGGFLDGMGLAVIAGLCWKKLAAQIPNFNPLAGNRILHIGGRDLDQEERELLRQTDVAVIDADTINSANTPKTLLEKLENLREVVSEIHLHIDLDVLNPKEAPANSYVTEEGGLSVKQLTEIIQLIKLKFKIGSATIAAFDPEFDPHSMTLNAVLRLINKILE